uniref:Uncharacterized protein n=1 Tax=Arundo donax TaxID=35708 RepID=A0A0A9G902_ARUDO
MCTAGLQYQMQQWTQKVLCWGHRKFCYNI